MKKSFIISLLVLSAACTLEGPENSGTTVLKVDISSDATKTYMDPDGNNGEHQIYWSNGDCLSLNGTASNPLSGIGEGTTSANFNFSGVINPPYSILYPASMWKDASTITLPAAQSYAAGSFATGTEPLAGYSADGSTVSVQHLCAMVRISVKQDAGVTPSKLSKVIFKGKADEQVSGDFTIDYTVPSLTGAAASGSGRSVSVNNINQDLSESSNLNIVLVVPANIYASGFTIELIDEFSRKMTKERNSSIELKTGKLTTFPEFTFVPSATATELGIPNIEEEVIVPDNTFNVIGRVVDTSSNPIEGVVVSDGTKCVQTMVDGTFYMESDIADVKFVFVSTPSGYMPQVVNGIPKFYKAKDGITPSNGVYDFGDYVLTPVANPDRYTLLITADPQPRSNGWGLDKIAYKSLEVCEDLYDELYDVADAISGRQVYGICLGDIVHENMSLFTNYNTGLARLGFPTYNIIGNHDNDPSGTNDDEGAAVFESYYGPRNYSFNIGGIHFVMLDNIMMWQDPTDSNRLTGQTEGLSDAIWTWLQNDLAMVPTSSKLMVCAHAPMFKRLTSADRTGGSHPAVHGADYGNLINQYSEVHAWAGHTHIGLNYVYPSSHRNKNVQVHTLARSTGELWTNEYLAAGTPRGFTIVEVDNGNISWRFHPVTRQRGAFQGVSTGYCSAGAPAYDYRDWNYNSSGVAVMKDGSGALTEAYQLHAYPRGAYGDDYIYANVFLWDENWDLPVWTPDGGTPVTMTRLVTPDTQETVFKESDPVKDKIYDAADTEFRTWYKTYANKSGASLVALSSYRTKEAYSDNGYLVTIFRAPASATPNGGTVSVTDRFGNTYSRHISW